MLNEDGMTYPEGSCEVACDLKLWGIIASSLEVTWF